MRVVVFVNGLGFGGTEKAAVRWACGLHRRGYSVEVLSLAAGPRQDELEREGVHTRVLERSAERIAQALTSSKPDVIHTHVPGFPHPGDIMGKALQRLSKIPVVQTNVFGRLQNPAEDKWTDLRLFISWTSCVQAASRASRKIDGEFFRKASVVSYPVEADDSENAAERTMFRTQIGVEPHDVLFGRISRPEPNKWTDLALDAFVHAAQSASNIKLLLREPPPLVVTRLRNHALRDRIIVLRATTDAAELRRTISAVDAILHTSSIGESFGYGIAEPMILAKPIISNSTPWADQAQIELVRHGECGLIASTVPSLSRAILQLASNAELRDAMGRRGQRHIQRVADPDVSLGRLEAILEAALLSRENPFAVEDLSRAHEAAQYLHRNQFGTSFRDQLALRSFGYRVRMAEIRKTIAQSFTRHIR